MIVRNGDFFISEGGSIKCVVSIDDVNITFDDKSTVETSTLEGHRFLFKGYGTSEAEWDVMQLSNFIVCCCEFASRLLTEAIDIQRKISQLLNQFDNTSPHFQTELALLLGRLDSLGAMIVGVVSEVKAKLVRINTMIEIAPSQADGVLLHIALQTTYAIESIGKSVVEIVSVAHSFEIKTNLNATIKSSL